MNKVISIMVILYLSFSIFQLGKSDDLLVHFLDVGQGDSILIQIPGGYNILVDGGEGNEVLIGLGRYLPPWDRKIDLMVLTHPHLDHLGGLIEVLDRYEVKELWLNPIGYRIPEFLTFIDKVDSDINSIEIVFPNKGYSKKYGNLDVEVFWPKSKTVYRDFIDFSNNIRLADEETSRIHTFSGNEVNNSSIVLLLSYGKFDVLLTGDAENEVEEQLSIGLRKNNPIEVLKAGHHCSRTASSEKLLSIIYTKTAICSYGEDNKFGHPHIETLGRFEEYKIRYFSTAKRGTISVSSDGTNWEIIEK